MRAYWFTGLALVGLAQESRAADWLRIGTSEQGAALYLDNETVDGSDGKGKVWLKYDYSKDKTRREREAKDYYRIDCSARTMTLLSYITYAPNGRVLHSETISEFSQKADIVAPDTLGESVLKAVCHD